MQTQNLEFRVLVKGKPITEYVHNCDFFVEGREGSEFELEVTNRAPYRVEAVVTVDGLSVIDGKEGSEESSGYLIDANSTLRIPGWKLDNEQAAKFVFSGKGKSYATEMTGSSRNNGVIGIMVFAERYKRPVTKTRERPANVGWDGRLMQNPQPLWNGQIPVSMGQPATMGYVNTSHSTAGAVNTVSMGTATSGSNDLSYFSKKMMRGMPVPQSYYGLDDGDTVASLSANPAPRATFGAALNSAQATMDWMDYEQERGSSISKGLRSRSKSAQPQAASLNNLGTGFGDATNFETETVTFDRGDLVEMYVVFYDNARGLKARGIQVGRPSRVKHTAQTPQAFPGMVKGCKPPKGWSPK